GQGTAVGEDLAVHRVLLKKNYEQPRVLNNLSGPRMQMHFNRSQRQAMAIGIVLAVRLTSSFQEVGRPRLKRQTALHICADVSELPITYGVPKIGRIYFPSGLPQPG